MQARGAIRPGQGVLSPAEIPARGRVLPGVQRVPPGSGNIHTCGRCAGHAGSRGGVGRWPNLILCGSGITAHRTRRPVGPAPRLTVHRPTTHRHRRLPARTQEAGSRTRSRRCIHAHGGAGRGWEEAEAGGVGTPMAGVHRRPVRTHPAHYNFRRIWAIIVGLTWIALRQVGS